MSSGKRVARVKVTLSKRVVDSLEPGGKPWIAWDDRLTGFGVQVHPTGVKSYLLAYRVGRGRRAPNKRVVIGRTDRISADRARRTAQEMLGKAAAGEDPAAKPVEVRRVPLLREAMEDYLALNRKRRERTVLDYRRDCTRYLSDWFDRPLDSITRGEIEARFDRLSAERGWATGNKVLSLLRSIYRRPCVDHDGLRNPVEQWLAGGGRFNRKVRRKIPPPAEVLPKWRKGIEGSVRSPLMRDMLWFGVYTGMRLGEVLPLRWERVDLEALAFRVDATKTDVPLELPVTRQLAAVLERRRAEGGRSAEGWVFPSSQSRTGHVATAENLYEGIEKAGGAKFWFHALRNCFITVAERDLMLPPTLTKRLVNHAPPNDVTEGYATDWTIDQLRDPAQRIADRIDALMVKS